MPFSELIRVIEENCARGVFQAAASRYWPGDDHVARPRQAFHDDAGNQGRPIHAAGLLRSRLSFGQNPFEIRGKDLLELRFDQWSSLRF